MAFIKSFDDFHLYESDDEMGDEFEDTADSPEEIESTEIEEPVVAEPAAEPVAETPAEPKHYMLFQNMKTIKSHIDMLMSLDVEAIDHIIDAGHDWATDHIATAKDDIEEVCDFLCAKIKK